MPNTTAVNTQITDSITQANVTNIAEAPAISMANTYQVFGQVVGASMQNAISNQQGVATIDLAITTQGTSVLYNLSAATASKSTSEILGGNPIAEQLTSLQAAAQGF
ncbi:MAG: RebB family R body protein [Sneathiella sp.]